MSMSYPSHHTFFTFYFSLSSKRDDDDVRSVISIHDRDFAVTHNRRSTLEGS